MTEEGENKNKEDEKTVTIKGVRSDLFKKIKEMAYQSGKTVGEITNRAYESLLNGAQGLGEISRSFQKGIQESGSILISSLDELSVDSKEILSEGKRVVFRNIKKLTLTSLDDATIEKYIGGIYEVEELNASGNFSKIKLLARCNHVKKLNLSQQ
ncbi:MAG: hypothetical protein RXR36_05395 [Nitrososphaeria archaeon]